MSNQEKRTERENKELRRQIELLKAQLKSSGASYITEVSPSRTEVIERSSDPSENTPKIKAKHLEFYESSKHVKKDLIKTFSISILIFAIIFGLFFSGKL